MRKFFAISCLLFLGCQMQPQVVRPSLSGEGEVYVYLKPFPREAQRLQFNLSGVYAVGEDGSKIPLELRTAQFTPAPVPAQRLVAWGILPPGRYSGLAFMAKDALLRAEDGTQASMLVPEKPAVMGLPFSIKVRAGTVIDMSFRYDKAVSGGSSFTPVFDLKLPERPVDALLGYVVNYASNDITVFNKAAMEVTGVIATGAGPAGMALDLKNGRAFVALSREDAVDVIDTSHSAVIDRVRLTAGDRPRALALTADGSTLLVANAGSNTVSFVDPVSHIEFWRVRVGIEPAYVVTGPSAGKAYVFNRFSASISVIDVPSRSVVASMPVDIEPFRGAFNGSGNRFYLLNEGSPYLSIIDPSSFSIIKRQLVGPGMQAIKIDKNTGFIYIGMAHGAEIYIYNPLILTQPIDFARAGLGVNYMTIDGDENNLCAVDPVLRRLFFINLVSKEIRSSIDVGDGPCWAALSGER